MKNPGIGRLTAALQRRRVPADTIAAFIKESRGKDGGLTISGMRFALHERDDVEQIIDEACGGEPAAVEETGTQTASESAADEGTGERPEA